MLAGCKLENCWDTWWWATQPFWTTSQSRSREKHQLSQFSVRRCWNTLTHSALNIFYQFYHFSSTLRPHKQPQTTSNFNQSAWHQPARSCIQQYSMYVDDFQTLKLPILIVGIRIQHLENKKHQYHTELLINHSATATQEVKFPSWPQADFWTCSKLTRRSLNLTHVCKTKVAPSYATKY